MLCIKIGWDLKMVAMLSLSNDMGKLFEIRNTCRKVNHQMIETHLKLVDVSISKLSYLVITCAKYLLSGWSLYRLQCIYDLIIAYIAVLNMQINLFRLFSFIIKVF